MTITLADMYAQVLAEPSDINEHLPTLVAAVEELNATTVVECGVRFGISTVALLYALENRGHLYSVDCALPAARPPDPSLRSPEWEFNLLDPQGPLGVCDWWHFALGYDHWPETLAMLPDTCDLLLVDSQHTYEQTSLELELYIPRVRKGGRALFHDTNLRETGNATTPQPPFPVLTALREYAEAHGLEWSNVEHCNGLGTLYC